MHRNRSTNPTLSSASRHLASLMCVTLLGAATAAHGQADAPSIGVEAERQAARAAATAQRDFDREVQRRDRLIRELYDLETQSINTVVNNQHPPSGMLEKQALLNRLRSTELHVKVMADLHGFAIPRRVDPANEPLPTPAQRHQQAQDTAIDELAPEAAGRMRHRVRQSVAEMFRGLSFDTFPN